MGIKDKIVSKGAEKFLNSMLEGIGTITNFLIDSKNKSIEISINLTGEDRPVKIVVEEYEIKEERDGEYLIIHKLTASRAWMNMAFEKYFKGKGLAIPDEYDFIIRKAL